jgi:hypothetical protein
MILPIDFFFQKIKLNLRTCMTLKSSVVIFQAFEPLRPQWPLQPHFIKKITASDDCIIPTFEMTNTGSFLSNGSSKLQIFTDI